MDSPPPAGDGAFRLQGWVKQSMPPLEAVLGNLTWKVNLRDAIRAYKTQTCEGDESHMLTVAVLLVWAGNIQLNWIASSSAGRFIRSMSFL